MLVRVRLALADVALRGQLLEALADPHCYVIAEGTEAAPGLVNESFDLAVLDRAALAQASDLLQALRALPDRPTLVVLDEGQDDGRHATLGAAGADAVLEPGPGLVPALRALVERSRERRLERHQAGLRERRQPVDLIANSPAMRAVMETVHRVAYADSPVLIQGETGVGKERIAAAIHGSGPRAQGPFVSVNCAALPAELFESELFGHAKGAFTGAHRAHRGQFERADRGVLLLDEIGEVPLPLQAKLLRAIQDQRIRPVGADEAIEVDVRIVAATNRDLEAEVEAGRFRRDLFYRLCVVEIMVPSLRERPEDIPLYVESFLADQAAAGFAFTIDPATIEQLARRPWPGNVRELRNVLERAAALGEVDPPAGDPMLPPVVAPDPDDPRDSLATLDVRVDPAIPFKTGKALLVGQYEKAYVELLMQEHDGNITRAARAAEIDRVYLLRLLDKFGMRPTKQKPG